MLFKISSPGQKVEELVLVEVADSDKASTVHTDFVEFLQNYKIRAELSAQNVKKIYRRKKASEDWHKCAKIPKFAV